MRVLILGGDGYLGWPTATYFSSLGHEVLVVDNYYRRLIAEATDSAPLFETPLLSERCRLYKEFSGKEIACRIGDLSKPEFIFSVFEEFKPETIVHYAEQPSAPYSMRGFSEARETLQNNLDVTFNCLWAMIKYTPDAHLIKLGTMGEYGTPDIDIPEGWIDIEKNGRKDKFLFPRAAGSLYHTTKVLDTDLIWFYVRTYGLSVTDLMQGPVYGLNTFEDDMPDNLYPNFHYDDIFGTVVNRFLVQAVAGIPLTVYGKGGQTRGYLNLKDTLQCVELAAQNPSQPGELRIFNQLTETFTVNEIAERIVNAANTMGISAEIKSITNPRKEKEEHYYNPAYSGLMELGLKPNFMTDDVLCEMLTQILKHKSRISNDRVMPRVSWS
jgi:UDP-sulfoquinovose synthase